MKNKKLKSFGKKELPPAMREFDLAWKEYFKNKSKPKTDEEEKKQSEEFIYWYNNVRKQSDTGKTPAKMYKEIYGKEPPKSPTEVSRMMNFEWDEDYDEDYDLGQVDSVEVKAYSYRNKLLE